MGVAAIGVCIIAAPLVVTGGINHNWRRLFTRAWRGWVRYKWRAEKLPESCAESVVREPLSASGMNPKAAQVASDIVDMLLPSLERRSKLGKIKEALWNDPKDLYDFGKDYLPKRRNCPDNYGDYRDDQNEDLA